VTEFPLSAGADRFNGIGSWNPLEAIRDGIQDYEYAHLLKSQGQDSFLAMVLKPVARSWTTGTTSRHSETARQKLGRQLHELSQP